jgi:hypothetical protein
VRLFAAAFCPLVGLLVGCQASNQPPGLPNTEGGMPPLTDGGTDANAITMLGSASNPKAIALYGKYLYYTNFATGTNLDGFIGLVTTDSSTAPLRFEIGLTGPWAMTMAG